MGLEYPHVPERSSIMFSLENTDTSLRRKCLRCWNHDGNLASTYVRLTLMSILQSIAWRLDEGSIRPLVPLPKKAPRLRTMYLTSEVFEAINRERTDESEIERYAKMEADLGSFITSKTLDSKYLYLLSPTRDSVWEIRTVRPDPGIRTLGLFAGKNIFIATNYVSRDQLPGWNTPEWRAAKKRAQACWRNLFPGYEPLRSKDIHELIDGAIDGKYFR